MSETQKRIFIEDRKDDKDLEPDEVLEKANDVMKDRWLGIFIQLNNSRRFRKFLEDNFYIGDQIDEENKTIETLVVENPVSVGPPLTAVQMTGVLGALKMAGCPEATQTCQRIFEILGQDSDSVKLITSATDEDIRQAAVTADLIKKLD